MTIAVDISDVVQRSLDTDRTLVAKVLRRAKFFVRYLWALYNRRRLTALMAAIHSNFSDSKGWVAGRRLELRKTSGSSLNKGDISWDAPIVVVVMYEEKGCLKEACGMSLYIKRNTLYIKQLQGGSRVKFPRKFNVWPQLFVRSCIAFAEAVSFDRVCVAKAHTLYPYRWPGGLASTSTETLRDHRDRMVRRYNQTALTLGFKSEGNWFVWENPKLRR